MSEYRRPELAALGLQGGDKGQGRGGAEGKEGEERKGERKKRKAEDVGSGRRVERMKAVGDEKRKWRQEEGIAPRRGGGEESKNGGKAEGREKSYLQKANCL